MTVESLQDQLWQRAVDGDTDAFATIYRQLANRVYTHCYRRMLCAQDAEDITAEVFAETWRRREVIRILAGTDIIAWLLATANNMIRRRGRLVARDDRLVLRLATRPDLPDVASAVAEQDEAMQRLGQLNEVLGHLGPDDQEVIWLCTVEGLRPAALARATGQSAATIRSRLSRALRRAKKKHAALYPGASSYDGMTR